MSKRTLIVKDELSEEFEERLIASSIFFSIDNPEAVLDGNDPEYIFESAKDTILAAEVLTDLEK